MKAIQVATVSAELTLAVLDTVLGSLEAALSELGAERIWVELDGSAFAVMAELPDISGTLGDKNGRGPVAVGSDSC